MPEHANRFAGLYDQQNENRIPDWGGDQLFTRMPSPPKVDDAPAPRYRPALTLVEPAPAPIVEAHDTDPHDGDADAAAEDWRRAHDDPAAEALRAAQADAAADARRRAGARERRRSQTAGEAMAERAERLGIALVEDDRPAGGLDEELEATIRAWDDKAEIALEPEERAPNGRRTKVITGRPEAARRPLSLVPQERRRPPRTPAEWIGPRPERIVAWAFVLGLLLILVAISTADAATL
jgi:hypothetical protein